MADKLVRMIWIYLKVIWEKYGHLLPRVHNGSLSFFWRLRLAGRWHEYLPVGTNDDDNDHSEYDNEDMTERPGYSTTVLALGTRQMSSYSGYFLAAGFIASLLACVLATHSVFGNKMSWYYTLVPILLALPVAMTGIRGLAESDFNAGSGLGRAKNSK